MGSILDETQEERDQELHDLTGVPLEEIKGYEIAAPEFIKIYNGNQEPETEEGYLSLYQNYKFMKFVGYLKTLMYTSIYGRDQKLLRVLRDTHNQVCLDFGSGVGTHTIVLFENDNEVDMLDVDGLLLVFAMDRIWNRGLPLSPANIYYPADKLSKGKYDLIICIGVLEHVFNPMKELDRMRISLKKGGKLVLEVSHMIKPSSGHFASSIKKWQLESPDYLSEYFNDEDGLYIKK